MTYRHLLAVLGFITVFVWSVVLSFPDDKLRVIACDVGQGDAILITYKNFQILTDGGADKKVLNCLSRYMPFWDRKIDVVILTNGDLDHYGGLLEVFKRYSVGKYFQNPVEDSTQSYRLLQELVGSKNITTIQGVGGQRIVYDLIYLDILYPENSDQGLKTNSQNNLSTVTKLSFASFEALLTGDIEEEAADYIGQNINVGDIDYIKISHHGSKNGTTKLLLDKTRPEFAVISAGKNNKYGHPHQEVITLLNDLKIKVYGTYATGDVVLEVDKDGLFSFR